MPWVSLVLPALWMPLAFRVITRRVSEEAKTIEGMNECQLMLKRIPPWLLGSFLLCDRLIAYRAPPLSGSPLPTTYVDTAYLVLVVVYSNFLLTEMFASVLGSAFIRRRSKATLSYEVSLSLAIEGMVVVTYAQMYFHSGSSLGARRSPGLTDCEPHVPDVVAPVAVCGRHAAHVVGRQLSPGAPQSLDALVDDAAHRLRLLR